MPAQYDTYFIDRINSGVLILLPTTGRSAGPSAQNAPNGVFSSIFRLWGSKRRAGNTASKQAWPKKPQAQLGNSFLEPVCTQFRAGGPNVTKTGSRTLFAHSFELGGANVTKTRSRSLFAQSFELGAQT